MELVAFSGYARVGKDEASKALEQLGYQRVAFADKLRDFLYTLNPIVFVDEWVDEYEPTNHGADAIRLAQVIDQYGWNGYKETVFSTEIRQLLQRLGTECGRELIYDNVWVDAALDPLDPDGKYVVTDCRFLNEAEAVRSRGGKIFRIARKGVGPANSHASETSLDDYDFDGFIVNDGTIDQFHADVRRKVQELCE